MVVVFELDGVEYRCEAMEFSTCGAFLACDVQDAPGHLELRIDAGGRTLRIPGDVVRTGPDGLGVVFGSLRPAVRDRLDHLLRSGDEPAAVEDTGTKPDTPEPAGRIEVSGEDWTPPVTEPILHQWKPETELVPPPPGEPEPATWENLPTISPQAVFTAPSPESTRAEPSPAGPADPPADAPPGDIRREQPAPGEQPDTLADAYLAGDAAGAEPVDFDVDAAAQELDSLIDESFEEAAAAVPTGEQPIPDEEARPRPPAPVEAQLAPGPAPAGAGSVPTETADAVPPAGEDPADRRKTERVEQSIPVTFDTMTSLIKEFTHNISFGGLFVYTTSPLQKGTETAVTLVHPVHGERLSLLATVVHASSAPSPDPVSGAQRYGIGVEFRLPPTELKRLLSDFITSHTRQAAPTQAAGFVSEARTILARGARSYHELLGVDANAPLDEIRRAYFKLVDRFHPDRYFGKVGKADQQTLEELFRNLTKAYEELTT